MADVPWDEDVTTDDTTPVGEWNAFKDRIISIAGDKSVEDGFLRLKQGTLEDRPAPVMEGRLYYSTDEGIWYRDSGTEWKELVREEGEIRLEELGEKSYSSLDDIPSEFTPETHDLAGNDHDGPTSDLSLNDQRIVDLEDPSGAAHAATQGWVNEAMPGDYELYPLIEFYSDAPSDPGEEEIWYRSDTGELCAMDGNLIAHIIAKSPDHLRLDELQEPSSAITFNQQNLEDIDEVHANELHGEVYYGDLIFEEKRCEVCGEKFSEGEKVSLIVNEVKEDGTYLLPKHEGC